MRRSLHQASGMQLEGLRAEIEACQKRLLQSDVALKGVIFNDVQRAGVSQAYRYGTAAYQYAYGKKKG